MARGPRTDHRSDEQSDLVDKLVSINRVAKVVKGGKNFSFSAVVVAGDGAGKVGYGTGKAREVPPAIQKASEQARKEMVEIPLVSGTVPHLVWGRWGATKVLLRPASPGTGVIAGGGVRAVMESAGVADVLTKIIGSRNPFNVVRATFNAIDRAMATGKYVAGATGVRLERMSPGIAAAYMIMIPMVWVTGMDTGVVFCRREDFVTIGGYNENRLFAEDVQFLLDMKRLGRRRGQSLARVTSAKSISSTRKFDLVLVLFNNK